LLNKTAASQKNLKIKIMQILHERQIRQKTKRLAIEILEKNYGESAIFLVGINNNGFRFAELLGEELQKITPKSTKIELARVRLNPAKPTESPVLLEISPEKLADSAIILVDDVANSGRTLFFAMKPFLEFLPKRIEVAVLVERMHKSFPIKCDYVGLALATTLLDDVDCQLGLEKTEIAVFLN
jgi:pyrimidine operon attenuation protein/uracil phosphoribosyltransferase